MSGWMPPRHGGYRPGLHIESERALARADALLIANQSIRFASDEARRCYAGLPESFRVPPPPRPSPIELHGAWLVAVSLGAMTGALLGWLAPAVVTALIIAVLLLDYWCDPTNQLDGYSPTVRRMARRW